jgi:Hydantoinase B/oxoprolinase
VLYYTNVHFIAFVSACVVLLLTVPICFHTLLLVACTQVKFSIAQGLDDVGTVSAKDYLDDGTCIQLAVTIDRTKKCAVFDFTGTGPEVIAIYYCYYYLLLLLQLSMLPLLLLLLLLTLSLLSVFYHHFFSVAVVLFERIASFCEC